MIKNNKEESELIRIFNDPQPLPRKVPDYMRKKGGAWYWTGAMVMITFIYEALTGLVILFYYQPSAAYSSTQNFVQSVPFGSLILTTHLYGAYAMIIFLYIHLLRNLFVGAYKRPRKNQWFTGILLLILTIAVGFFGYSMSGDVLSADATDVGRGIAQATPLIGDYLKRMFFGDGTSLSLFQRMLGWHIVIAGGIALLFATHFFLAERNTIMPKRSESDYKAPLVDKETGAYKPWYPYNLLYMGEISLLVISAIIMVPSILAALPHVPALFDPFPQVSPSSPLASTVPAYPPWFLLFVYKAMDFKVVESTGVFWGTIIFAGMPFLYLLLLPYIDTSNKLKLIDRPITVSFGIMGILYMVGLSVWGALTPGIAIPNWEVLVFFIAIGAAVLFIVLSFTKYKTEGRIKLYQAERVYLMIVSAGVTAFGAGALIVPSITSGSPIYIIPAILLAITTALIIVGVFWHLTFARSYETYVKPVKRISSRAYVLLAAALTFAAIVIISIISGLDPASVSNEAGYGVGLGLLFLIAATILKIYRAAEYGE